ncbi:MAG: cytochrome c [Bauldia sp.]
MSDPSKAGQERRGFAGIGRLSLAAAAIALFALVSGGAHPSVAQGAAAGLTGAKHTDDVVMARQLLMDAVETEMGVIEGGKADLANLKNRAYSINTLLSAFPHLFPPETKPGPDVSTSATPAVWQDFEKFYDKVQNAANVAFDASQAEDAAKFGAAAKSLRAACDTCHETYMLVVGPR